MASSLVSLPIAFHASIYKYLLGADLYNLMATAKIFKNYVNIVGPGLYVDFTNGNVTNKTFKYFPTIRAAKISLHGRMESLFHLKMVRNLSIGGIEPKGKFMIQSIIAMPLERLNMVYGINCQEIIKNIPTLQYVKLTYINTYVQVDNHLIKSITVINPSANIFDLKKCASLIKFETVRNDNYAQEFAVNKIISVPDSLKKLILREKTYTKIKKNILGNTKLEKIITFRIKEKDLTFLSEAKIVKAEWFICESLNLRLLTNVVDLSLGGIESIDLSPILFLTKCKKLTLGCRVKNLFSTDTFMPMLLQLTYFHSKISLEDHEILPYLINAREVNVRISKKFQCKHFSILKNVERLTIEGLSIEPLTVPTINKLTKLDYLCLDNLHLVIREPTRFIASVHFIKCVVVTVAATNLISSPEPEDKYDYYLNYVNANHITVNDDYTFWGTMISRMRILEYDDVQNSKIIKDRNPRTFIQYYDPLKLNDSKSKIITFR
jgi:Leucine-rich repeat (LRR) protein